MTSSFLPGSGYVSTGLTISAYSFPFWPFAIPVLVCADGMWFWQDESGYGTSHCTPG